MKISMKEYNLDWFKSKDLYTWEEITDIILDMEREIYQLRDILDTIKQDVEDNYERVSVAKQVGVSDRDFI